VYEEKDLKRRKMSKVKFMFEGGSATRPPLFEGANYYFWKGKMELFLQSQDNHMWSIN